MARSAQKTSRRPNSPRQPTRRASARSAHNTMPSSPDAALWQPTPCRCASRVKTPRRPHQARPPARATACRHQQRRENRSRVENLPAHRLGNRHPFSPPCQDRGMSRICHNDKQKARILREFEHHDGSAASFCRHRSVSYQTIMNWRGHASTNLPNPNNHRHSLSSTLNPRTAGPHPSACSSNSNSVAESSSASSTSSVTAWTSAPTPWAMPPQKSPTSAACWPDV